MAKLIDVMVSALGFMGKLSSGTIALGLTGSNLQESVCDPDMVANEGDFAGGTLFLLEAAQGPTSHRVVNYHEAIKTFSITPGSIYKAIGQAYAVTVVGRSALVNAINSALLAMGEHTAFIDKLITSDADGTFELPATVHNVKRIQVLNASLLGDHPGIAPSRRYQFQNWREAKIGAKYGLVFDGIQVVDCPVSFRIWYGSSHPRVTKDDDEILPDYHLERLAWETAYWSYFQYLAQENNANDKNTIIFQTIMEMKRSLANRYPVPQVYKDPILPRN